MTKRNLFAEISEGFEALAEHRGGKRTLRTHEVQDIPAASDPGERVDRPARKPPFVPSCIRPLLANQSEDAGELGTGPRQAECAGCTFDRLVQRFPDTVDRLASV
ncbi:transcriptional regulator [Variovorax sp. CF079]|uniref:transcriptional regulator n=1 Tax=Variovorax sp. CF079 TaxID=1882774 RepID=UPI001FCE0DFB|nr:transcriptional regulator [Variovorax sp. CF079]